jgi:predicted Ser/Thr protein kinase
MSDSRSCPQCGEPIAEDSADRYCVVCLEKAAFDSPHASPSVFAPTRSSPVAGGLGFVPPSSEELQSQFPQFEILELLGKGGMGAVYKARQRSLDRLVAVKILPTEVGAQSEFAERFTREARALAKLSHPHIVTVYDFGQTAAGQFYFLMEYIDGQTLRQAMQAQRLTIPETSAIVTQVCDALQFAHDAGIVHRDIKPENVLIDRSGRVRIADFGLARLIGHDTDHDRLTMTRQVMGTLRYMAPEQIEGAADIDHRADIYALGVVFYELLTGTLPLGRFRAPSEKQAGDARLDRIVLRMLEREPGDRYQRAADARSDLQSMTAVESPRLPTASASPDRDTATLATTSPMERRPAQRRGPWAWIVWVFGAASLLVGWLWSSVAPGLLTNNGLMLGPVAMLLLAAIGFLGLRGLVRWLSRPRLVAGSGQLQSPAETLGHWYRGHQSVIRPLLTGLLVAGSIWLLVFSLFLLTAGSAGQRPENQLAAIAMLLFSIAVFVWVVRFFTNWTTSVTELVSTLRTKLSSSSGAGSAGGSSTVQSLLTLPQKTVKWVALRGALFFVGLLLLISTVATVGLTANSRTLETTGGGWLPAIALTACGLLLAVFLRLLRSVTGRRREASSLVTKLGVGASVLGAAMVPLTWVELTYSGEPSVYGSGSDSWQGLAAFGLFLTPLIVMYVGSTRLPPLVLPALRLGTGLAIAGLLYSAVFWAWRTPAFIAAWISPRIEAWIAAREDGTNLPGVIDRIIVTPAFWVCLGCAGALVLLALNGFRTLVLGGPPGSQESTHSTDPMRVAARGIQPDSRPQDPAATFPPG